MNASPVPPSRGPVADWRLGLETGRVEAQCRKSFRGKQVVHSPSRSLPETVIRAFSSSLATTVFSQRSMRRLIPPPQGGTEGPNLHLPHSTAIDHSATKQPPAFVAHPVAQRALIDVYFPGHFGDRTRRLDHHLHRLVLALRRELPPPFRHCYPSIPVRILLGPVSGIREALQGPCR